MANDSNCDLDVTGGGVGESGGDEGDLGGEIRNRVTEVRRVLGRDLLPNPKNPRVHGAAQRRALREVLGLVGVADVLLARETEFGLMLLDGHCRAELEPDVEWTVAVLDVDEHEADVLLATLDPLAGMADTDESALAALQAGMDEDLLALLEPPRADCARREKPLEPPAPGVPVQEFNWFLVWVPVDEFADVRPKVEALKEHKGVLVESVVCSGKKVYRV